MSRRLIPLGDLVCHGRSTAIIGLDPGASPEIRFQLNPLIVGVASLIDGLRPCPDAHAARGWGQLVWPRRVAFDHEALAVYTCAEGVADFLVPEPTGRSQGFREQVARLRATRPAEVRRAISELFGPEPPSAYRAFARKPTATIERVCAALLAYWDAVLGPRWVTLEATLEREVTRQAYGFGTLEVATALAGVHPLIQVSSGDLCVHGQSGDSRCHLGGRVIVLSPVVCDAQAISVDTGRPDAVRITYSAPGAEDALTTDSAPADACLAELIGHSRAAILLAVCAAGATTTDLSRDLYLAPATVSAHLTELARIGLLERRRSGRWVHYGLSRAGQRLLDTFAAPRPELDRG